MTIAYAFRPLLTAGLLALSLPALAQPGAQTNAQTTIREEQVLKVDGRAEVWRLSWIGPVKPFCGPDAGDDVITVPCSGFAYGEQGRLVLSRTLPGGQLDDQLDLSPLFAGSDLTDHEGNAVLPRWPILDEDTHRLVADDATLAAEIRARPPVPVIKPVDYDRDGLAQEFLIQTDVQPGGKRFYVAVGVNRTTGRLDWLRSTARPDRPLVLNWAVWQALAKGAQNIDVVRWDCGDHGSEVLETYRLSGKAGRVDVRLRTFACADAGGIGDLQQEEPH